MCYVPTSATVYMQRSEDLWESLLSLLCSEDQIHVSGLVIDVLSHLASFIVYS